MDGYSHERYHRAYWRVIQSKGTVNEFAARREWQEVKKLRKEWWDRIGSASEAARIESRMVGSRIAAELVN